MNNIIKRLSAWASSATTSMQMKLSALIAALMVFGAPSFASGETITFDLTPFFTSLNDYLPVFVGIFAIIGGIVAAMGFAKYIIGVIVNALSGKGSL